MSRKSKKIMESAERSSHYADLIATQDSVTRVLNVAKSRQFVSGRYVLIERLYEYDEKLREANRKVFQLQRQIDRVKKFFEIE